MICQPCGSAGDCNSRGLLATAELNHKMCHGESHCDCQHKVGPSEKFIDPTRIRTDNGNEEN